MDPKLLNDVWRGWCLTLLEEFRELQEKVPALASVPPPNIVVNLRLTTTLGNWEERSRRISIASHLFESGDLDDIITVFKHELAHLIVSDVYGIHNAEDHGEAFRRACKALGIPDTARIDLGQVRRNRQKGLLTRVEKLMALGRSANEHEAEQALAKAQELALKHNLEALEKEPEPYGVRIVGPVKKRLPSYTWRICEIVSEHYFTMYICRNCIDPRGDTYRVVELYGHPDNLDTAEYVYYFLQNQGRVQWRRYRLRNRLSNNRLRLSFLDGLYVGFGEKLEAQTKRLAETEALIWLGDPELEAFYKKRNPRVRTQTVKNQLQVEAHSDGQKVGKQLNVNPGLQKRKGKGGVKGLLH